MNNKVTGKRTAYAHEVKGFVQHIVNWRARLLRMGVSKKNEMLMRNLVTKFKPYTTYNFTDIGAARFLQKHGDDIAKLIPSRAELIKNQYIGLRSKASEMLNPKLEMV